MDTGIVDIGVDGNGYRTTCYAGRLTGSHHEAFGCGFDLRLRDVGDGKLTRRGYCSLIGDVLETLALMRQISVVDTDSNTSHEDRQNEREKRRSGALDVGHEGRRHPGLAGTRSAFQTKTSKTHRVNSLQKGLEVGAGSGTQCGSGRGPNALSRCEHKEGLRCNLDLNSRDCGLK
ncbi:MAG: hypothetical protein AAF638_13955 [Pseudomonadota bacterium]